MNLQFKPTLLNKKLILLFAFCGLFFMNCSKSGNVKWMYYDETTCADKWAFDLNNEKLKDNVTAYLDSKGIKVLEIEIYVDGTAESCSACTCKTGRRIKCKVKKREADNMNSEGFY